MESTFTELKVQLLILRTVNYSYSITQNITVGKHLWKVQCRPWCHERFDSMSLVLQATSTSHGINATFIAFAVGTDDNGAPSPSCATTSPCGWINFIRRSDLDWIHAPDDVVTIVCGVIFAGAANGITNGAANGTTNGAANGTTNGAANGTTAPTIPLPPASDVGNHLGSLLRSGQGSDFSFVVGGVTFPVHRAVLAARSPVFKAELLGSMAEAKMPSVVLQGIEPAVFRALLEFAYTDALPADKDYLEGSPIDALQDLLAAADQYAMDRLKIVCAQKLHDKLSADTVMGVLACAERYSCPELKNSCMDFIVRDQNFKQVTFRDDYMQFYQRFPSIIAELRKRAGM